jgi:four helix bundle protein
VVSWIVRFRASVDQAPTPFKTKTSPGLKLSWTAKNRVLVKRQGVSYNRACMTYKRFEDLPIWNEAMRLAHRVFDLTENPHFKISFSLRDQIERSVMSISDNVAEGFERGTANELLAFLYIARGSAGETRSKLCFMEKRPALADFKSEIADLKLLAESCSRQLRGWAESLQNSDIPGQRHLNRRTRQAADAKQRAAAFQRLLLSKLPPSHPLVHEAKDKGLL